MIRMTWRDRQADQRRQLLARARRGSHEYAGRLLELADQAPPEVAPLLAELRRVLAADLPARSILRRIALAWPGPHLVEAVP